MPILHGLFVAPTGAISADPPVILIHGAYGSHLDWPAALRRMNSTRVLVLDLPGHGKSPGAGRDSISAYADDVIGLLDGLNIERAIFAGHSMGGAIALTLALDAPQRVAGLILIGTGARLRVHPSILGNLLNDTEAVARQITGWVWSTNAPPKALERTRAQILALDPLITLGDFQACNRFDVTGRLGDIAVPTLIITGSEDRMVTPKHSEYLAAHIAGAKLVIIQNAGHMVALEQPTLVAAQIEAWRAAHAAKGG